jgi:hypothetical protein
LLLSLLGSLAGCGGGVRAPVRDATYGIFDAIQNPPPGDVLARDLRRLVQAYVERALQAGPPEDLSKIAGRITSEVIAATAASAPEARRLIGMMVDEALRTGAARLREELPVLGQTGARLTRELERSAEGVTARVVRGALETSLVELEREARGGAGDGPLAHAAQAMAERAARATVLGATEGLRAEAAPCEGPGCGVDLVRSASRSMVAGAIEGVRGEVGPWLLVLAFGLGVVVSAVALGIVHLARRRPEPASR